MGFLETTPPDADIYATPGYQIAAQKLLSLQALANGI